MFEYTQDIGLLHGALLSAASSNSGSLLNCQDVTDAVKTVHDTIKKIIQKAVSGVEDERKTFEIRLHLNEKLHAAVFFTLLRSHGIKSDDADEFYGSIVYNLPSFDITFYLELIYICDWSEYFIKCSLQLPEKALFEVLEITKDKCVSCQINNFLKHFTLQILISKLFSTPHEEVKFPFNFNFVARDEDISDKSLKDIEIVKSSSNIIEEECSKISEPSENFNEKNETTDMTPPYEKMLCVLLDCISSQLEVTDDINILKILLHALKKMLKVGLVSKSMNSLSTLQLFRISSIISLLNKFLQSETNQEKLKYELQRSPKLFISHVYATSSWSVSLNYLLLLLSYYSDEWISALEEDSPLNTKTDLTTLVSMLNNLNFPFVKMDEYLKLLTKVIQLDLQGSSYIAKIFITDSTLKDRKDILKIVEENFHVINFVHSYSIMIDSIKNAKSEESKLKLLQIFYNCTCGIEISMYDTLLNYILCKYGFTDEFQLPNFNDQLLEFSRVSPTLEKAEKDLPMMFIQNPITVLRYLIDQMLVQGSEGKVFIQLLAHFPKACLYSKNHDDLCALHLVLDEYFKKKKLQAYEVKNMVTLYKFLTEVHSEQSIFSPCSFFRKCIIPRLQSDYSKIELILECAYSLLPVLLTDDYFLVDSEFLPHFISSLGLLVNNFIVTGNGKLKSLVLPILKEFETYQIKHCRMTDEMKGEVRSSLHLVNEMALVYIEKFLPRNIEYTSEMYIWTWCCKNEDSSNFEEKFSIKNLTYISLINTMSEFIFYQVLPHLTKEEWLFSIKLLKICCKNTNLIHEMTLFNNPLQLFESESNTYPIALALVNSLHFIINDDIERSSFISSCFSNGLINLLSQEKNLQTNVLLSIVLEVIYLVSCISADLIQIYASILLELLKKIIVSSSVQLYQEIYKKIIFHAIDCLPNLSAKNYLYNKCNI